MDSFFKHVNAPNNHNYTKEKICVKINIVLAENFKVGKTAFFSLLTYKKYNEYIEHDCSLDGTIEAFF